MFVTRWSKWFSFKELEILDFKPIPVEGGVYQVRCAIYGKPKGIPRAGGMDEGGILYTGKTESKQGLRQRIKLFWRGIHEEGKTLEDLRVPHSGANTYVIYGFSRIFPIECLEVRWSIVDRPSEVEKELLEEYARKYFDKPPLNLAVRR